MSGNSTDNISLPTDVATVGSGGENVLTSLYVIKSSATKSY